MLQNNQKLILIQDLGYLYPNNNSKQKRLYGIYKCHCGVEFRSMAQNVKTYTTTSCGCTKNVTHGLRSNPIYGTWNNMIQRCKNEKHKKYKIYGGRGISVCERWLDVANFIEDMYPSYIKGLSLDRIDNDGNYELFNCRWTTNEVQQRNKRILQSNNTSGYKGVVLNKKSNKFMAQIVVNGKQIHIGCYSDYVIAAIEYNKYVSDNNLNHSINKI